MRAEARQRMTSPMSEPGERLAYLAEAVEQQFESQAGFLSQDSRCFFLVSVLLGAPAGNDRARLHAPGLPPAHHITLALPAAALQAAACREPAPSSYGA